MKVDYIIIIWALMFFSITAITCSPLSNLTNGSVSYSNVPGENNSYPFNAMAIYSCNSGFALVGNKTRNCSGDGSTTTGDFDGLAPTCNGIIICLLCLVGIKLYNFTAITCSPLTDPINGTIIYSAAADGVGNYVLNVTANHSCESGFSLVGNNSRTCTGDGSSTTGAFYGEAPHCEGEYVQIIVTNHDHAGKPCIP